MAPSPDTPSQLSLPTTPPAIRNIRVCLAIAAGTRSASRLAAAALLSDSRPRLSLALYLRRRRVFARYAAFPRRALQRERAPGDSIANSAALEPAALGWHRAVLSLAAFCRRDDPFRQAAALEPVSVLRHALRRQQPVRCLLSRQPALLSAADRAGVQRQRTAASHPLRLVYYSCCSGVCAAPRARRCWAARSYAYSAWQVAWLQLPTFLATSCWFPLLLRQVLDLRAGRRSGRGSGSRSLLLRAAALAAVVGLMLLAGHLQIAFYGLLAGILLAFARLGEEGRQAGVSAALRLLTAYVGALAVGLMLAMPQVLPALELSRFSHRAGKATAAGYAAYAEYALPPAGSDAA